MIEREPFKPTIKKEDFWEEGEKYLIGVEHYRQALFLPALTIEEIVDLQAAINNFLSEKQIYCFEVETLYKSGRKRSEIIVSADEESMWKLYDKHHNKNLVENSAIVDAWIY